MAAATDYAEEKIVKHIVGNTSWTMPTGSYLAIHTADPGETGSSSEASGGSYARQSITWTYNSGSARMENSASLAFGPMVGATYTHFSVKDASSGGNTLFKGSLTTPRTLSTGQSLVVAVAALQLTAD